MIYCLVGENDYLIRQAIASLCPDGSAVRYDGPDTAVDDLPRLLNSQTLFSQTSCVIIESASSNKSLWSALEANLADVDGDTTLILVETKPDKRTKTYKWLQKNAKIIDCSPMKVSERQAAESWLAQEAKSRQIKISRQLISDMVDRAIRISEVDEKITLIDQQLLTTALDQLKASEGEISADMLATVLPPSLYENVFDLLALALNGRADKVRQMCEHLQSTQDGYKVLALLASQAVSAVALLISEGKSAESVATDIKAHPYALKQLEKSIHNVEPSVAIAMVDNLTVADERLKRGQGDPWQLVEQALTSLAVDK